jgi:hypothetical protein
MQDETPKEFLNRRSQPFGRFRGKVHGGNQCRQFDLNRCMMLSTNPLWNPIQLLGDNALQKPYLALMLETTSLQECRPKWVWAPAVNLWTCIVHILHPAK